jgi:hypothetical protein
LALSRFLMRAVTRMHQPSIDPEARRRHLLRMLLGSVAGVALCGCRNPVPALRVGSIVFPTYEYAFLARELGWIASSRAAASISTPTWSMPSWPCKTSFRTSRRASSTRSEMAGDGALHAARHHRELTRAAGLPEAHPG